MKAVIFDMDGVLMDTERLIHEVTGALIREHFQKEYKASQFVHLLGRAPRDAVGEMISLLELGCSVDDYLALSKPLLLKAWAGASTIPGAVRLVEHLVAHGVPIAVATSSDRVSVTRKVEKHLSWFSAFGDRVVTSDDVVKSKPAPEIFLRACALLPGSISPEDCVVIEDSPAGIIAARAAGMYAVALVSDAVPPELYEAAAPSERVTSFFEMDPAKWGLPPFADLVCATVPTLPPLRLEGVVVRGFGRGSKELGIPTANLPAEAYGELLSATSCGIYHGFAQVDDGAVHKMVTSIGRNPFYGNAHKTIEPHILHTFPGDFYGATLRLTIVGYIRPERNYPSLEALIAAIHSDIECARSALDDPIFEALRQDELFVVPRQPAQ